MAQQELQDEDPEPEIVESSKCIPVKKAHTRNQKLGFLTRFHKPRWLLFAVCCTTFLQGVITDGFVNTSVTSIERRFSLSSTQSGLIVSIYFFTGVFVNLLVSHIGGRGHKARWLAAGMVLYGAGAFIYVLPHFLTGPYHYSRSVEYSSLCKLDDTNMTQQPPLSTEEDSDVSDVTEVSKYLYFFIVAQILLGVGASPIYTLGIAYLDENVSVPKSGVYLGIFQVSATLGPAIGYVTGGILLRFYTDLQEAENVSISSSDPGWVGAWWLGMVVACPMPMLVALFLLIFPRELPGTEDVRKSKVSVAHKRGGDDILSARADFGKKPKDFFIALKLLFRNPTMMFLNLVSVFEGMSIIGFAAYMPKLIETLFGQTSAFSATVFGSTIILGGCGGNFIGGCCVKRFRWDVRANIYFCIAMSFCSMILVSAFLLRCPNQKIVAERAEASASSISDSCSRHCSCSTHEYRPLCALNGDTQYFSPCHAGCSKDFNNGSFGDCTCLPEQPILTEGRCDSSGCSQLYVFIFVLYLIIFFRFLPYIPGLHASLRCVPESQRSLSLGLNNVLAKIFGSFPAPIVFGAIFDSTCLVWQTNGDGDKNGSCWLYDADELSWRVLMLSELLSIGIIVGLMLAVYFYAPVGQFNKGYDANSLKERIDVKRTFQLYEN